MTIALLFTGHAAAAQQPPPIDGVTGTVALEGTVEKTYEGLNTVVVKTIDGIGHLFHLTGRTVVHVGKDIDRAAADTANVIVSVTDGAGRPIVHYFKRVS